MEEMSETTYRNHRVEYIDIFRGIGILCMIVGHVTLRGVLACT